ncbi:glycosyltransferase [Kocuria carniphila]|uniref:D-inositol 3-phosphate glycosyltransferase n=1 Tax=Kocuria carniphila TaxID=262208 RepID=A0ABV3V0A1_9MICC|nr:MULTISPECIES: glycosyltransferase [Kocuria]MCT1804010.1 glycosyltransferase [Kocuria carniphila]
MSTEHPEEQRPLKILIIAETYPPDINGSAQFARRLAQGMLRRGHEVHVMAPMTSRGKSLTVEKDGVTEHRIRSHRAFTHSYFRLCFPWEIYSEIKRVIDEVQPDVVHSQCHYILGRLAIQEAQRRGIRLVGTNHFIPENIEPFLPFPEWFIRGYRKVSWWDLARQFRRCDVVTAPTQLAVDTMVTNGVDDNAIPVSNGIQVGDYELHPGENLKKPNRETVLFCGRLAVEKNVNELIEAISLIPAEKNVHAEIVGEGEQLDTLVSLAHSLGVAERIHFRGFLTDEQLRVSYLNADVFCQPGTAELQSLVTLEAMSASTPVVLANARALPHLADEGVNGYLFEPGNPQDLAEKLQLVLDASPERQRAMGEASHRMMAQHSFAKTLDTFERIYRGEPV